MPRSPLRARVILTGTASWSGSLVPSGRNLRTGRAAHLVCVDRPGWDAACSLVGVHLPELKQVVVADLLIRAYRSGINHVSGGCRSRRLTRTAHSGGVVHLINRRFLSSRHLVGSAVLALALTVSAASLVSGASAPVGAAFSPQQGVVAPTVVAATSGSAASPVPGVRFVGSGDWATPNGRSDGSRWNAVERPITVGSVAAVSELWRSDDGFIQSQEEWLAAYELLIFRGGDGMVAVDAATGQRRWEFSGGVQSMNAVGSSLYIRGYRTGVGSTTGVMALDLTSGRTRWSTPTDVNGSPYGTNLVTAGGLLVGTYFDGSVRAFRLSDGRLMWRTMRPVPRPSNDRWIDRGGRCRSLEGHRSANPCCSLPADGQGPVAGERRRVLAGFDCPVRFHLGDCR